MLEPAGAGLGIATALAAEACAAVGESSLKAPEWRLVWRAL